MNRISSYAASKQSVRVIAVASVTAIGLVLSGCSTGSGDGTSDSTTASTAMPTPSVTAGSGDVAALAEAFAATLDEEQRAALSQDYTFENATNWSNFPNALLAGGSPGGGGGAPDASGAPDGSGMPEGSGAPDGSGMPEGSGAPDGGQGPTGGTAPDGDGAPSGGGMGSSSSTGRVGVQTSTFSDEQWNAFFALVAAATGSAENEGFDEVYQHLLADDYLADNGGGDNYGHGDFFVAFLGDPATDSTWELQVGGHHLAIANTYTDGALAGATPSFRGIEPYSTVEVDGVSVQPEQQEQEAYAAFLASLTDEQRSAAQLDGSYGDILLGPGSDWAFPETAEGLKVSELNDEQKQLLVDAIQLWVGDIDDADAATYLVTYESELDETYVGYTGDTGMTSIGDYFRIDGPSVWIESSMQNGVVLEGAHPYAVWRDKTKDYGGLTS